MKRLQFISILFLLLSSCQTKENYFIKSWSNLNERVWIGSEFWSNRLQDWKVQNNRLECVANSPQLLMRTTHLINCRLGIEEGTFTAKVNMGALQLSMNDDAACGFLIGAGSALDVWGASLIQQNIGPGAGLFVGITFSGELFVRDMETGKDLKTAKSKMEEVNYLIVEIKDHHIELKCGNTSLSVNNIANINLSGNIALVSHPGGGENPGSFWFNNLEIWGSKLKTFEHTAGPIFSTQYTLSNNILKLTAQMAPMSKSDPNKVYLEVEKDGKWEQIAEAKIITPGYAATFKVANWDDSFDQPYRVKYVYQSSTNEYETVFWNGTVRNNPKEKEEIVIAGFTGNHNISHPGLSRTNIQFNFNPEGIWYPHLDIVKNIKFHNPDILFFSGDQVYENSSPTISDTKNYELDYLYKWYLYCLAYRDLTKDIPTISIPDDHDVYQGNLWGQNGRATDIDNKGGYVHPAWFVKMVERIQCGNLPDPYDPTPIEQGIGVYYTSMNYGGIGFAILEDRKFKSGCDDIPFITNGRPDHVIDPKFDTKKLDLPEKELLGNRQLEFLKDWAVNWEDQDMKIALSQTIFANVATNHGGELSRVIADLDSNGWPQTGRNNAIDVLRKSFTFHLAGDQHLASIVHHGIDTWGDGIYSFCVPSIANFYPRAWWPESVGQDRPVGEPQNLGKHKDGFGNFVTVYGVTNPTGFTKISTNHEPLNLHDKAPGYGIVKMNKKYRTIKMECWPRYADPQNDKQQYTGWPKTVNQFDNYGREAYSYLPNILVEGLENPVIKIIDEKTGELVYCVRILGNEFKPKVFKQSSYEITLIDTEKDLSKIIDGVLPGNDKKIVQF